MPLNAIDRLISGFDHALRALTGPALSVRPTPGAALPEAALSDEERRLAGALLRVDHSGEVCAQALYEGQALTARSARVRQVMESAAREEIEHLAWTEQRLAALGARRSLLNPLWYAGSFALGAASGLLGDRWNLGFLAETERQVEGHLDDHLARLPAADQKSRHVLEQMKADEQRHADTARRNGAAELPLAVRGLMRLSSRVMTRTAFRL